MTRLVETVEGSHIVNACNSEPSVWAMRSADALRLDSVDASYATMILLSMPPHRIRIAWDGNFCVNSSLTHSAVLIFSERES